MLPLIFAFALIARPAMAQGNLSQVREHLYDELENAKEQIQKAESQDLKLSRFRAMKESLQADLDLLEDMDPEKTRNLRMTLHGLTHYFGLVSDQKFAKKDCLSYRKKITEHATARPEGLHSVSWEAQEALEVLELLCR